MCKCTDKGCYDCLMCSLKHMAKKMAKRKAKKAKVVKKKTKREPPAKCGLCRRKLIPGDSGSYCMTCQYRMDNAGR